MSHKRDLAGVLVGEYARYMEDAPNSPYHIRLGGRFFSSDCTHKLADRIEDNFSKRELVALVKMIPDSEDDDGEI